MSWGEPRTLVDIDADFLFEGTSSIVLTPDKRQWCSAEKLVTALREADLLGGEIRASLDQQETLYHWDQLAVRGAICVHIDAHRDVYARQSGADRSPRGVRGNRVGCGDYLFHALREGIVRQVIQVIPDAMEFPECARDIVAGCGPELARSVTLTRLSRLSEAVPLLGIAPPILTTVAVSPEWLPELGWSQVAALLTGLGLDATDTQNLERSTRARWEEVRRTGDVDAIRRFEFPYDCATDAARGVS